MQLAGVVMPPGALHFLSYILALSEYRGGGTAEVAKNHALSLSHCFMHVKLFYYSWLIGRA